MATASASRLLKSDEQGLLKGEIEKMATREPFSRYLPYLAYGDGVYENGDNTTGRIWECRPITYLGDKTTQTLSSLLRQEYPDETVIQFILYPDDNIDPIVDKYKNLKVRDDELIRESAARYADHILKGKKGIENLRGIPMRNFRLFVAIKSPTLLTDEQVAMVQENLAAGGFAPRRMEPGVLLEFLRRLFNKDVPLHPQTYDERKFIRNQVIQAESSVVALEDGVIQIGGRYAACITPKSMPDVVDGLPMNKVIGGYMGREDDGTQLLHRFLWSTSVCSRTNAKDIKSKAGISMAQRVSGSLAKTVGRRNAEYNWVLDELESEPYVNVITSMWVFGDDPEDLNRGLARARGLWEKQHFVMQREDHVARAMLVASLPFGLYTGGPKFDNLSTLDRDFAVNVTAAANLLPVQGDFSGGGMNPIALFSGRKGQLCSIDLFDKGANNHNFLACAGSGAGKSFVANFLMGNYYAAGSLLRITDIGYSYKKQCMAAKGRFIDIGDEAQGKLCLNPFPNTDRAGSGDDDKDGNITMTGNIVLTMIYSSTGTASLSETHFSLVKDAVRFAMNRDGGLMGIDHVYEYLSKFPKLCGGATSFEQATNLAHEMAFNLRDFISGGKYGRLFNGKSTLNIKDDDFVVLEMEQLLNDEELFRVIAMQVINTITTDLYLSDRSQQRIMLFDEAWKYLASKGGTTEIIANVIAEGYRRARKYGGSTGIVTQSPLDLLNFGSAGTVIKSNSAFKFFLESEDYRVAVDKGVLEYSGLLLDLAASVKNNKPYYSEILVDTTFGAGVARLCVDPWTYWMYTSAAPEVAKFEALVSQGMTAKQALDKLSGVSR